MVVGHDEQVWLGVCGGPRRAARGRKGRPSPRVPLACPSTQTWTLPEGRLLKMWKPQRRSSSIQNQIMHLQVNTHITFAPGCSWLAASMMLVVSAP